MGAIITVLFSEVSNQQEKFMIPGKRRKEKVREPNNQNLFSPGTISIVFTVFSMGKNKFYRESIPLFHLYFLLKHAVGFNPKN